MFFIKFTNYQVRKKFNLSAQMVVRAVGKVAEYHSSIINNVLRVRGQADLGYIDGKFYSGAKVKNLRRRNSKLRQKLQAKGKKSAKRLLKSRRRKESRFAADVNYYISKRLVQVAKGTYRAIVLEDLKGIRERAKKGTRKTVNKKNILSVLRVATPLIQTSMPQLTLLIVGLKSISHTRWHKLTASPRL